MSPSAKTLALATQAAVSSCVTDSLAAQQNIIRGVRSKSLSTTSAYIAEKAQRTEAAMEASRGVVTTEAVVSVFAEKGLAVCVPASVPIDGIRARSAPLAPVVTHAPAFTTGPHPRMHP